MEEILKTIGNMNESINGLSKIAINLMECIKVQSERINVLESVIKDLKNKK